MYMLIFAFLSFYRYNSLMLKDDGLHLPISIIDGHQKPIRCIISAREDGKSTIVNLKSFDAFKKNKATSIYFKRQIISISDMYIQSIFSTIEDWRGIKLEPRYSAQERNSGVVPIYIGSDLFMVIIALSVPKDRYKSLVIQNPALFFSDEVIIDSRAGEKYLAREAFRAKEAYSTFYRRGSNVPWYLCGNPYSLWNPYFKDWGIDPSELAKKKFIDKGNVSVWYHELNPLLKDKILKKNPTYEFDVDYFQYALEGRAINDANIRLRANCPNHYSLVCSFYFDKQFFGIWRNQFYDYNNRYWVGEIKNPMRKTLCFDFGDLMNGVSLFSRAERDRFAGLANAIRNRAVEYQSIACENAMEEIYNYL